MPRKAQPPEGVCEAQITYRQSRPAAKLQAASSPDAAAAILRHAIPQDDRERFVLLALDPRNRVRAWYVVSIGTLVTCPVHPREVFRAAIALGAASIVLGHNHPSGDPEPSEDDLALTRRLVRAGALLGIPVVDHVILGENGHVSLAERGVI